ncbi:MAG: hypothetical protein CMC78_05430 [Flavobacteriaceae bacterium]|nr:hypothetical protein [Flavobacteriaceae bacterium]
MKKIYHICLITSCIIPNTISGPITNFTKKERLFQLTNNINYLLKTSLFKKIYIIDPFLNNELKIKKFNYDLFKNGLIKSDKLKFLTFNPNEKTKLEIKKKGKGYSELEMIIEGTKKIKKDYVNTLIHKISGRYKILNIKEIVSKSEVILNNKKGLYLPFSRLLSKCFTVLITYKSDIDIKLFVHCLRDINDKKNKYTEHSFYKNLVKNNISYRNNRVPKFELDMLGGSKQGRYGRLKQLINKLLYGYL